MTTHLIKKAFATLLLTTLSATAWAQVWSTMKVDREYAGVNYLQDETLAKSIGLTKTLKGKGVLLAVYDGGSFDATHIAFIDPISHESRVKAITTYVNRTTYNQPEVINNYVSTPLVSDHGTHVLGIAGGSYDNGMGLQGVAPESSLMIVHAKAEYDAIAFSLQRVKEVADSLGMPCVVNMSLGNEEHMKLRQTYSKSLSALNNFTNYGDAPGIILCVSSGNAGDPNGTKGISYIAEDDEPRYVLTYAFPINDVNYSDSINNITVWTSDIEHTTLTLEAYDMDKGCVVEDCNLYGLEDIINLTTENLKSYLSSAEDIYGNKFLESDLGDIQMGYCSRPNIALRYGIKCPKGTKVMAQISDINPNSPEGYLQNTDPLPLTQANTLAPTQSVISVGCMSAKDATFGGINYTAGMMWKRSSWGETVNGIRYPDVSTPGVQILSSVPGQLETSNPLLVDNPYLERSDSLYKYRYQTGTSMASPFMAGVAALLLEYDPTLSINRLRQLLYETNDWNESCESEVGAVAGNGILNVRKLMLALMAEKASSVIGVTDKTSRLTGNDIVKTIEKGRLTIYKGNKAYNAQGQRVH